MTKVRNATLDDLDFLIEKAVKFNNDYYYVPLNIEKTLNHLTLLIEHLQGVVLVSDRGAITGIVYESPTHDWITLVETAWYSEGKDGLRLLQAFEDRGRLLGVDEVRLTTQAANNGVSKVLLRRGYKEQETSFKLKL